MAGNTQTFADWNAGYDPHGGETAPVLGPTPSFRNAKDARLSAWGTSPDVQHPDGYLGTQGASTRRQDKLLDSVHRQNHRSYSRGVHKGERVNPGDYMWPEEFTPDRGIMHQMKGKRLGNQIVTPKQDLPGAAPAPHLTNDGKAGPRGIPTGLKREEAEIIDRQRQSLLRTLAPRWK